MKIFKTENNALFTSERYPLKNAAQFNNVYANGTYEYSNPFHAYFPIWIETVLRFTALTKINVSWQNSNNVLNIYLLLSVHHQ